MKYTLKIFTTYNKVIIHKLKYLKLVSASTNGPFQRQFSALCKKELKQDN